MAWDNAEKKRTTTTHGKSRQRTIRERILWGVILFACSFVVSGIGIRAAEGQTVMRVGVLPFRIYAVNPERIAEWSKKVVPLVSAELTKDERLVLIPESKVQEALEKTGRPVIDEQVAREIGRTVDADLMILGSLTQINGAISLDVRAVDVYQPGILASAFAEGKKMEDFPAMVSQVSREIRVRALKEEMVTQIVVEGNRAIEASAIRSILKMKEGDVLTPRGLREDVNSIYQLGYFQDVQAEKRDWGRGKAIVFIVEEKPVIREIKFSGNKKIKSSDLQEVIDLKPRSILNINAVKENQIKILKKYKEEAYFAAEVEYELETPRKGDVIVHYKINENKKIPIRKITFAGNLHFSDAQLKSLLPETKEKDWLSWIRKTGIYKEDVLERDLDAILGFYYQNGFLDAKAGKATVTFDAKGMTIQIPVEEGRQFKVGKVDIQGDLIAPQEELFKLVSLYVGEILNRDRIRDSVMRLTDRYADRGYAFVDVNPQTIVHPEKDLVDIVFDIQQGNKVYFDRINITGNHKTRDKVIRRELKIQEGELYSLSGVKKSRDNLNYVGYFKEVNVTTKKGAGEDKLDADVKVEEMPTGAFSLGGGYSSIDKFVGIVSLSQNNLFGLGQKLGGYAQIGAISQYFNISFTDPYLLDTRISFTASLYKTLRDYTEYVIERTGGELRFGYPLIDEIRAYAGYRYEIDNITDVVQNASLIIQDAAGESRTSAVSLALRRDTRNHYFDPTAGSDVGISLDYAGGPLGGTNYFTRYGAEAKIFLTPDRRVTFMGRGIVGYIQPNEGHKLPLQERYRLGGIYTLRGFEAYSVGPKAPNGEVIGGDKQLLFNVEAIFPIYSEIKLKGVVFFDAGNAYDVGEPIRLQDLRTSVGFGVRWISPVGPLRLEWGYNLSPKPGEKQSAWDFAIGTFF